MILIAESGSTKTTWCLTDGTDTQFCSTAGINPFLLDASGIRRLLETEFTLSRKTVSTVFYYGAGALKEMRALLFEVLAGFFGTSDVQIHTDLLAAARSLCQRQAGIVCILGTGSNSCYYDGNEIVHHVPPLGFILGDEGSGSDLGRRLVSDILKHQLSTAICDEFFTTYPMTVTEILDKTYRQVFPNRFLAQYTRFIADHIAHPEIEQLVCDRFEAFFRRNVLQYKEVTQYPICFTGGVAFHFRDTLEKIARTFGLTIWTITREPISGLVAYHLKS
jgi:N-acetylglucosamine kinase-like BadF-type ATPase